MDGFFLLDLSPVHWLGLLLVVGSVSLSEAGQGEKARASKGARRRDEIEARGLGGPQAGSDSGCSLGIWEVLSLLRPHSDLGGKPTAQVGSTPWGAPKDFVSHYRSPLGS